MDLNELHADPTPERFQQAWHERTHKTSISAVTTADFCAYLRRNAPAGETAVHLYLITTGAVTLLSSHQHHRGVFDPPLPAVQEGQTIAVLFIGRHQQMLSARLHTRHPLTPATVEADKHRHTP